jgi:hypothetical protein
LGEPDPEQAHGYLVAIGIGQLIFIVFGHGYDAGVNATPQNALATRLVQVWPPINETAAWPPDEPLDDFGLDASVRALGAFPGISLPGEGD